MEKVLSIATIVLFAYILFVRIREKKTTVLEQLSEKEEDAKQPIRDYTNAVPLTILVGIIFAGIFAFVFQSPDLLTPIIIVNLVILLFSGFLAIYPIIKNKIKIKKMIKNNSIRCYDAVLVNYKYHRVANHRYTFYPVYAFTYKEKTRYLLGDKPDRKSRLAKEVKVYILEEKNILYITEKF